MEVSLKLEDSQHELKKKNVCSEGENFNCFIKKENTMGKLIGIKTEVTDLRNSSKEVEEFDMKLNNVKLELLHEELDLKEEFMTATQTIHYHSHSTKFNEEYTQMGERPFAKFSSNRETHTKTHAGEKRIQCKICDLELPNITKLKIHLRSHTGEKPFECKICSHKFSQNSSLTRHKKTHTGEKPFKCKSCSFKFSQIAALKIHTRIHTGEKPFVCKICNYKFTHLSSLKMHIRAHTGDKPYPCKICNLKFTNSGSLKTHLRSHTGEKPFKCKICTKKFSQSTSLRRHIRTSH